MNSLKEYFTNKYSWNEMPKSSKSKKLVLILFKNEVEIHICKVLFLCDDNTAGVRSHKTAIEFMVNLNTGKITSSSIDSTYIILIPNMKDSNQSKINFNEKSHKLCELMIKDVISDIEKINNQINISPFDYKYI